MEMCNGGAVMNRNIPSDDAIAQNLQSLSTLEHARYPEMEIFLREWRE